MILNPANIQLTKVHYYDSFKKQRNTQREIIDNKINSKIIKHSFASNRYILHINPPPKKQRRNISTKLLCVYCGVLILLIAAILCGIYLMFTGNHTGKLVNKTVVYIPKTIRKYELNVELVLNRLKNYRKHQIVKIKTTTVSPPTILKQICNCNKTQICMKINALDPPVCMRSRDAHDPSGCGGLCAINTQHCRLIHKPLQIYQCVNNTYNVLTCPSGYFSCGNARCLENEKRCDGYKHCKDNADELHCECDLSANFHCGNATSCISLAKKCDGNVDCWDVSDELNCHRCSDGELPCRTGLECIQRRHFCDGIYHCTDRSDEPIGC